MKKLRILLKKWVCIWRDAGSLQYFQQENITKLIIWDLGSILLWISQILVEWYGQIATDLSLIGCYRGCGIWHSLQSEWNWGLYLCVLDPSHQQISITRHSPQLSRMHLHLLPQFSSWTFLSRVWKKFVFLALSQYVLLNQLGWRRKGEGWTPLLVHLNTVMLQASNSCN